MISQKELKKRLSKLPKEEEINVICFDCGRARYGREPGVCTIYMHICNVCKKRKICTEPRDFIHGTIIKNDKTKSK